MGRQLAAKLLNNIDQLLHFLYPDLNLSAHNSGGGACGSNVCIVDHCREIASSISAGRLQSVKHPGGEKTAAHRAVATAQTIRAWANQ